MASQTLSYRCMDFLQTYHRNPSLKLRNKLVELNAGLVRKVAHQICRKCAEPYDQVRIAAGPLPYAAYWKREVIQRSQIQLHQPGNFLCWLIDAINCGYSV